MYWTYSSDRPEDPEVSEARRQLATEAARADSIELEPAAQRLSWRNRGCQIPGPRLRDESRKSLRTDDWSKAMVLYRRLTEIETPGHSAMGLRPRRVLQAYGELCAKLSRPLFKRKGVIETSGEKQVGDLLKPCSPYNASPGVSNNVSRPFGSSACHCPTSASIIDFTAPFASVSSPFI